MRRLGGFGLCGWARCEVSPLRQIDSIVIDSSSFTRDRGDNYRLGFSLRNNAAIDVAMPAIELSITDSQDQVLFRRVIWPAEFGTPSNLLGAGVPAAPKVQQRALEAGDLVLWYTDGVIDALDPAGKTFGDRRLQQLLKKLDRTQRSPAALHDVVLASVATHRAGSALIDDETIVVAQVAS